eukprot:scaffold13209_cov91-Isochrysis_galbana.AAC.2
MKLSSDRREGELSFWRRWRWWLGFFLLVVNATAIDLIAYGITPLSLIAPFAGCAPRAWMEASGHPYPPGSCSGHVSPRPSHARRPVWRQAKNKTPPRIRPSPFPAPTIRLTIVFSSLLAATGCLIEREVPSARGAMATLLVLTGVTIVSVFAPHGEGMHNHTPFGKGSEGMHNHTPFGKGSEGMHNHTPFGKGSEGMHNHPPPSGKGRGERGVGEEECMRGSPQSSRSLHHTGRAWCPPGKVEKRGRGGKRPASRSSSTP